MDYIMEAESAVLKDSNFLYLSTTCQELKCRAETEMQQLDEELEYHWSLMAEAHHVIGFAASLYEALQQVSSLSPLYYFPLRSFITSMQEVFAARDGPLVVFNTEKPAGSATPEVPNKMVTALLLKFSPCLVKSHHAALKLLLSVALLQNNRLCSDLDRSAFLRGLPDAEQSSDLSQPCWPSWIPPQTRRQLVTLEKIPAFEGLTASLLASPEQWHHYLCSPRSKVSEPVPCQSHRHLSLLQRALLWKTVTPECLEGLADAMAVYPFASNGQTAKNQDPLSGNPKGLLESVIKHKGPIILTLASSKRDSWKSSPPLLLIDQLINSGPETKKVTNHVFNCAHEFEVDCRSAAEALHHFLHFKHWFTA